jgi:hypothetical protein
MKRWLHEPLLHFLLAGALLFAAYGWLNREQALALGDRLKGAPFVQAYTS